MEKIAKGLHSLNKKLPIIDLRRDFLSFTLQIFSLFGSAVTAIIWVIFGFDSTIDGIIHLIEGKQIIEMGNGTHISTALNVFILMFIISVYLSKKEIIGFHNILISVFTPIVAMMVFEFPWVILTDLFHNAPIEGYWAITLFGIGFIDVGMLIFALGLIPLSCFYFAYTIGRKILLAEKPLIRFSLMAYIGVFSFISIISLTIGTLDVLYRNLFALFFVAFAHSTLMDATENWTNRDIIDKYKLSHRTKQTLIMTAISIAVFLIWVFYPYFTTVKGVYFPQTMYSFFETTSGSPDLIYLPNDGIHLINVVAKFVVSITATLAIIPKIEVRKKR
jgi:hypothetical protein